MGHLDDHRAEELGSRGSELQDAARDRFSLHQRWWVDQLVLLQIPAQKSLEFLWFLKSVSFHEQDLPAGHPHGHGSLPWRDDHSDSGVTTTPHRATTSVHHEGDEEPGGEQDVNDVAMTSPTTVSWSSESCCGDATHKFAGATLGGLPSMF